MFNRPKHDVQIVYRPKSHEEAMRRVQRAEACVGKPFLRSPGNPSPDSVAFISSDGKKVRYRDVEMVYNDALLQDAISDYGKDGPLYADSLDDSDGPLHREIWEFATRLYDGMRWPE